MTKRIVHKVLHTEQSPASGSFYYTFLCSTQHNGSVEDYIPHQDGEITCKKCLVIMSSPKKYKEAVQVKMRTFDLRTPDYIRKPLIGRLLDSLLKRH